MKTPFVVLALSISAVHAFAQDSQRVYFGTYTNPSSGSEGVYTARFDATTGELSAPVLAAKTTSPSFLTIHPTGSLLYTVGESPAPGRKSSDVSAFQISGTDGSLRPLNFVETAGKGACYVALDKGGKMLMTAQYGDGTLGSHKINADGHLSGIVSSIQHRVETPVPGRQDGPHAHSIFASPDNRFALSCDLGANKVFIYKIDPEAGTLTAHGSADLPTGAGPRHFAFHPNGRFVFVNNEMGMSVTSFAYDAQRGSMERLGTVSTLPPADRELKGLSTSETVVHPSGRFVYVANRTHDTIAVFKCDSATGALTLIQNAPAEGEVPRNFALDLTGKWMIVGHQKSNSAAVFSVDQDSGLLTYSGRKIKVGAPVCVRFLALK